MQNLQTPEKLHFLNIWLYFSFIFFFDHVFFCLLFSPHLYSSKGAQSLFSLGWTMQNQIPDGKDSCGQDCQPQPAKTPLTTPAPKHMAHIHMPIDSVLGTNQ